MTDFISILQSVALEASSSEAKRSPAASKEWKLNYKWLINPKVKCPWCLEWVPTGRVWVVDEAEQKVRRLWTLAGERLELDECHPHVGGGGKICMGNARTAVDALLASISNDAYPGAKPAVWFPRELDHVCPTMGGALDEEEEDEDHFSCASCNEYRHNDDGYFSNYTEDTYCQSCYYERHSSCEHCGEDFHENESPGLRDTPDGGYCESCFETRYFECEGCDEVFKLSERLGDDRCEDCYSEESEVAENELEDGLCENCQPPQEECVDCHFDYPAITMIAGLCPDCVDKQGEETNEIQDNQ